MHAQQRVQQRIEALNAIATPGRAPTEPSSRPALPPVALSAIVPMFQDRTDAVEVYNAYKAAVEAIGRPYELIYVVSSQSERALVDLKSLQARGESALTLVRGQQLDEAEALLSGFKQAQGEIILTLPPDLQVEPADIPKVVAELETCDVAAGRRPPIVATRPRLQAKAFHWLLRGLFGHAFTDLVCRVRAFRREVIEEISLHGVQPHFLPLLASERGFRIHEVDVRAGRTGRAGVQLSIWNRIGVLLDILALFLVVKFTKKPLRFFGMIGLPFLLLGVLSTGGLAIARLFFGVGLSDRPALILAVLLIVLGIQILALGLIGELVIFASGRRIKEYTIERIVGTVRTPER
jgi:glycosyltransferase involved in cell wall biosynthesis